MQSLEQRARKLSICPGCHRPKRTNRPLCGPCSEDYYAYKQDQTCPTFDAWLARYAPIATGHDGQLNRLSRRYTRLVTVAGHRLRLAALLAYARGDVKLGDKLQIATDALAELLLNVSNTGGPQS